MNDITPKMDDGLIAFHCEKCGRKADRTTMEGQYHQSMKNGNPFEVGQTLCDGFKWTIECHGQKFRFMMNSIEELVEDRPKSRYWKADIESGTLTPISESEWRK